MRSDRPLYAQAGETRYDTLSLLCDSGSLIHPVSALLESVPELQACDLNPVKVLAPEAGGIVLDGRVRLAPLR
jgi:hypothetical protein